MKLNNKKRNVLFIKASEMAEKAHRGQIYDKGTYFDNHIMKVVRELSVIPDFNSMLYMQIVGFLHDIIEDTHITFKDLVYTFGEDVTNSVYHLTDELGTSRTMRKQKNKQKIVGLKKLPDNLSKDASFIVKLSDRMCNIRCSFYTRPDLLKMYKKEHKDFEEVYLVFDEKHPVYGEFIENYNKVISTYLKGE